MPLRLPARAISEFFKDDNPSLSKSGLLLVHTFSNAESEEIASAIRLFPSEFRIDAYGNLEWRTSQGERKHFSTHPLFSPDPLEEGETLKGRVDSIAELSTKYSPYVYSAEKVASPNTRFVLMRHDGVYSLAYNVLHTSEFSEYYVHERSNHMNANNTNWGKHDEMKKRLNGYLRKQEIKVNGKDMYLDPSASMFKGSDAAAKAAVMGKNLVTFPISFTNALDKAAFDLYEKAPPGKRATALCEGPIQKHMKTHFPESFLEQGKFSGSNIELECEVRPMEYTICSQVIGGDHSEINSSGSNFVNQCNNEGDFIVNKDPPKQEEDNHDTTKPDKEDTTQPDEDDLSAPEPTQTEKYMILLLGAITFLAISVWIMTTPSQSKRASA